MKYLWQNGVIDNLWVLLIPIVILILGIVVEGFDKGVSNLSRTEEVVFFLACLALLVIIVTGI